MKCLSIRQPWAWLITHGHKDIENRSFPCRYRGWVLVHAGKKIDADAEQGFRLDSPWFNFPAQFETGGIVGAMYITDCVTESDSGWFVGDYGFVIEKAVPLPLIPFSGKLGFFEVPNEILPAGFAEMLK